MTLLLGFLIALAQGGVAPSLSGTWKLDPARSRVAQELGWPGLIGSGAAADRVHVTQAANGFLVIESEINESHARIYRPGGTTASPVAQTSSLTMTSRWEGGPLVSEGKLVPPTGEPAEVKETLSLLDQGGTLEVEISKKSASGTFSSTLVYFRVNAVEPCEKWPTPCKPPGSPPP
jgi:hypothetical protein